MADGWSKKQRRELRELQGLAWERELEEALRSLRKDFERWEGGEITVFELSDRIHKFHNGRSRELFNMYSGSLDNWWIGHTVGRPVYEKCIDAFIGRKSNRSYRVATDALLEAKPVFDAAGETAFDDCLIRLRDTHYRKRNLMATLDARIGAA